MNELNTTGVSEKRRKKWPYAVGIVVVVLTAVGVGLFVWHEQPSFCNALCHSPMDAYVEGYYSGDESKLVTTHAEAGAECLDCHVPSLDEQIAEGMKWVAGDFQDPLPSMEYDDSFCLNESCHNLTRDELEQATAGLAFNPHVGRHGNMPCSTCHGMHEASSLYCAQCHEDADALADELGWN